MVESKRKKYQKKKRKFLRYILWIEITVLCFINFIAGVLIGTIGTII